MNPKERLTPSHFERDPGLFGRFISRGSERARVARALARDRWGEIRDYTFRGPDPSLTQDELALMK